MKTAAYLIFSIMMIVSNVHAAAVTYGDTIDISGGLRLTDGQLCFADNTCQSTAVFSDGSAIWGQISGYIDNQLDLSTKFATKEDKANKDQPSGYAGLDLNSKITVTSLPSLAYAQTRLSVVGYTPSWQSQGSNWLDIPEYRTPITKKLPDTKLTITLNDNVGINGPVWCNLGIFVDRLVTQPAVPPDPPMSSIIVASVPSCTGSWSGQYGTATFNSQSLVCTLSGLPAGDYFFRVMHRSQNSVYGNYYIDDTGIDRTLTVTELL